MRLFITKCVKESQGKSTFYDRFMVELMEAYHDTFTSLYQEQKRAESPLKRLHEGTKKDGKLLPKSIIYVISE